MTTNSRNFAAFIAANIKANPAEATIVRKVYKALKDAGFPITSVFDGEEDTKVESLQDVLDLAFNLDDCFLRTSNDGWVRIVMGNEWDALADYTLSLEDALAPVNRYIESKG